MAQVQFAQWVIDEMLADGDSEALAQVVLMELGTSVAVDELRIYFDSDE